jgi:hypothetical protein
MRTIIGFLAASCVCIGVAGDDISLMAIGILGLLLGIVRKN